MARLGEWKRHLRKLLRKHKKGSRPALKTRVTALAQEWARAARLLIGKWVVWEQKGDGNAIKFDQQWQRVKAAMRDGRLGDTAKITDLRPGEERTRVMCVYTYSFEDEADVARVLRALHAIDVHPKTWKADMMTHLGLYASETGVRNMHHMTHDT